MSKLGLMKPETKRGFSTIKPNTKNPLASNDHSLNGKGVAEKIDQAADNEAVFYGKPVVSLSQR